MKSALFYAGITALTVGMLALLILIILGILSWLPHFKSKRDILENLGYWIKNIWHISAFISGVIIFALLWSA